MSKATSTSVDRFTILFQDLLKRAKELKPTGSLEPLLRYEDLKEGIDAVGFLSKDLGKVSNAAIEAAVRNIFYNLISSTPVRDAKFGHVWNLLDIANTVSDFEFTEAGLALHLVEELLEAQTLDGCRVVLDYLDSRQQFLTEKFFKNRKDLIILRSCNDLLRRSSRAEDNAFCGRVFIFLFQSVPFGDKSAVNLRGQFHTENVTIYEQLPEKIENAPEAMSVDAAGSSVGAERGSDAKMQSEKNTLQDGSQPDGTGKIVKFESSTEHSQEEDLDMDTLYSIFWSLQESFSQPMTLLNSENIQKLRKKLHTVMSKFKQIQQTQLSSGANKIPTETTRGTKRKREDGESDLTSIFNPKYLTSRDLFDLEVSDLSFRRHFLVQALILLDFLLSLTPKAKGKLYPPALESEKGNNNSTRYDYLLSEEDTKWASQVKAEIATYLQAGPEGKFYFRMVDTVLSRDKNWAYWKARSCPEIKLDPVTPDQLVEAEKAAQKACAPRRIRPTVLGALDLTFLGAKPNVNGLEKYKEPGRYQLPAVEALKGPIAEDEFDIENAKDDDEKRAAQDRRASKLWRTLRIASRGRLRAFDQIDDGNDLKPLFEPSGGKGQGKADSHGMNGLTGPAVQDEPQSLDTTQTESNMSPPTLSVEVTAG